MYSTSCLEGLHGYTTLAHWNFETFCGKNKTNKTYDGKQKECNDPRAEKGEKVRQLEEEINRLLVTPWMLQDTIINNDGEASHCSVVIFPLKTKKVTQEGIYCTKRTVKVAILKDASQERKEGLKGGGDGGMR